MQDKYHISEHFDGKIEEKADAEERRGSFLPRISRMGLPDKATAMGTCRSAPGMQARPGLQENRLPLGRGGAEGGKEGIFWTGCTGLTGWEGARVPIGCGVNAGRRGGKNIGARGNFPGLRCRDVGRGFSPRRGRCQPGGWRFRAADPPFRLISRRVNGLREEIIAQRRRDAERPERGKGYRSLSLAGLNDLRRSRAVQNGTRIRGFGRMSRPCRAWPGLTGSRGFTVSPARRPPLIRSSSSPG